VDGPTTAQVSAWYSAQIARHNRSQWLEERQSRQPRLLALDGLFQRSEGCEGDEGGHESEDRRTKNSGGGVAISAPARRRRSGFFLAAPHHVGGEAAQSGGGR
jgi:hypothetical protein